MYAQGGFLGLYKGNGANCLRVVPVYALKFSLNDQIKDWLALRRATEGAAAAAATEGARSSSGASASAHHSHGYGVGGAGAGGYELTVLEKIAAGCTAGVVQITLTYPLDLVRTRLQLAEAAGTHYSGIAHCLGDTWRREGPAALYKGLVPSMLAGVPYVGLQMTFYAELKRIAQGRGAGAGPGAGEGRPLGWGEMLLCGSAAGLSAQTLCYPLDTVRHRMQANGCQGQKRRAKAPFLASLGACPCVGSAASASASESPYPPHPTLPRVYAGTWECIVKILRHEGYRGFFKARPVGPSRSAAAVGGPALLRIESLAPAHLRAPAPSPLLHSQGWGLNTMRCSARYCCQSGCPLLIPLLAFPGGVPRAWIPCDCYFLCNYSSAVHLRFSRRAVPGAAVQFTSYDTLKRLLGLDA